MQPDHLFIICHQPDQAQKRLESAGFSLGKANHHPGQGTANHRVFFHGFMLELLYVYDEKELHDERAAVLQLAERFHGENGCLFGIASRPGMSQGESANYKSDIYRPEYLPDNCFVEVATGLTAQEPLWFHLPFLPADAHATINAGDQPRQHANTVQCLTGIELTLIQKPSKVSQAIAQQLGVSLKTGPAQRAHLIFDKGVQHVTNTELADLGLTFAY